MNSPLGKQLKRLDGPVLVTGHTGFKGIWLTLLLEHLGIPVIGLSLPAQEGSLFNQLNREGLIPEVFSDIRNFDSVKSFIRQLEPSVVFNMAAQPLVIEPYKTPRETFETNVMGTVNVLDACFQTESVRVVVGVTTDKVYRNDNSGKLFKEGDPLAGKDPYSASKVGSESAIAAWQQIQKVNGGPKVLSVRAGNVIGGGDWAADRLLPDLIRGFLRNDIIPIRNPNSTRPWQHVLDPLVGYLMASEAILNGAAIESLNFGPIEKSITVKEVVEKCALTWDSSGSIEFDFQTQDANIEAINLDLDSQKATSELGWKPKWSQAEAAVSTTNWWKKVSSGDFSPKTACLVDIEKALT